MLVAEHLEFDMAGAVDQFFQIDGRVAERVLGFATGGGDGRGQIGPSACSTMRIPLPPPPAVAFTSSGNPSPFAAPISSAISGPWG